MTQTPISVSERRLAIARRLYEALVHQDPDRAITLCDGNGRVVTHHYPRPEESSPETVLRDRRKVRGPEAEAS
jgi:hypothetical protein